ncbi:MAG: tetratricopeptide repeat protein [Candidatus Omnitrophica bacterium]|nr:tetratricopeptide repeat protein [Candidatus Omnitrophota bacterium]MBU1869887.1 tetratricopeptide repeat protein [Candidatus Omnitrophota bacterium]
MYNKLKDMPTTSFQKNTVSLIVAISFGFCTANFVFAQGTQSYTMRGGKKAVSKPAPSTAKLSPAEEEQITELQKMARDYRAQGYEAQKLGNLDLAMSYYQKAIEYDSAYAPAYNDLGVIYESKGFDDRAEQSYLQALRIDPDFMSAYSNLAMFYENKRDLDKAAACWKRRVELGDPEDPWTIKARKRLEDIKWVSSKNPQQEMQEEETVRLLNVVSAQKALEQKDNKELAKTYFKEAKMLFSKGDDVTAYKKAIDAKQLDQDNSEIEEFIDKVQVRLLSK